MTCLINNMHYKSFSINYTLYIITSVLIQYLITKTSIILFQCPFKILTHHQQGIGKISKS
jgi:hypothetical protein